MKEYLINEYLVPIFCTLFGAVIAHVSSKSILKKQFDQQQETLKLQKDQDKELLLNITKNILKQELINNREALKYVFTNSTLSSLEKMITSGNITQHKLNINTNHPLEFKTYEELKYSIFQYTDELLIQITDIYNILYSLERGCEVENLNIEEIKKLYNLTNNLDDLLKQLN